MFPDVINISYFYLSVKVLACLASVSVAFSVRSRHFSLFGGTKIGRALFCARPNFRAFKKRKMLQTCGKPYTTETFTTQVIKALFNTLFCYVAGFLVFVDDLSSPSFSDSFKIMMFRTEMADLYFVRFNKINKNLNYSHIKLKNTRKSLVG